MKFEELKALYPNLWERAKRKYSSQIAQRKYFMALVESTKARKIEKEMVARKNKEERKRRTRALILFALAVLERLDEEEVIALSDGKMTAKEGKKIVDYSNYLVEELKRIKKEN